MKYLKLSTLILFILISTGCSQKVNEYYDETKAHHTKEGFKNIYIDDKSKEGGLLTFFKMKFFGDEYWADHEALKDQVPVVDVDVELIHKDSPKPRITWLGHSTFLIQYKNINILTDPIFSDRASPLCFAGPKRYTRHPMDYKELPKIDVIVISHNHFDHLDKETLKKLAKQESSPMFYVPLGLKELLVEYGADENYVKEMDWLDSISLDIEEKQVLIKAHPSQHWSARSMFDRFKTLWASWSLKIDDFDFWFAGDTGYNDVQFKEIGKDLGGVDLALIPIGAYEPRWFMKLYHVNPTEAIYIHKDIKAKKSIGMHWGTFPLTAEEPNAPVIELKKALKEQGVSNDEFIVMDIGETLELE